MIEKYAVRAGGGFNHRFGLDSGVLIKENHIAAAGIGERERLEGARKLAPHTMRIEIECETLAQVEEALTAGADSILLDNMTLDDMRRARALAPAGRVQLEVSGGVTLDGVRAIAETGVDLISVGALTHSAPAVDLSMRIERSISSAMRIDRSGLTIPIMQPKPAAAGQRSDGGSITSRNRVDSADRRRTRRARRA